MPSGLFKQDTGHDRWVFSGPTPPSFQAYDKDHVDLLVRYMFQINADEQKRLTAGGGGATAPAQPAAAVKAASAKEGGARPGVRSSIGAGRAP